MTSENLKSDEMYTFAELINKIMLSDPICTGIQLASEIQAGITSREDFIAYPHTYIGNADKVSVTTDDVYEFVVDSLGFENVSCSELNEPIGRKLKKLRKAAKLGENTVKKVWNSEV